MKKRCLKEQKYRSIVFRMEDIRIIFKSILFNQYFPYQSRWACGFNLSILQKKSIASKLISRCIFTRHRKKFHFLFKFSRLVFLRLARSGQIFGLKKYVW